jgi:hypothetical protein
VVVVSALLVAVLAPLEEVVVTDLPESVVVVLVFPSCYPSFGVEVEVG